MGAGASASQASELLTALRSDQENVRIDALEKLKPNCDIGDMRGAIVDPTAGILVELVKLLRDSNGREKELAAACLWYLSRGYECKTIMSSRELGLLPLIVPNITLQPCMAVAINVSLCPDNFDYILSPEIGLISYSLSHLEGLRTKFMNNITATMEPRHVDLFLQYKPIDYILDAYKRVPPGDSNMRQGLLYLLLHSSHFPAVATVMKDSGAVPVVTEAMVFTGVSGLIATLTLCNLVGKDEASTSQQSILQERPEKFAMLLKLVQLLFDSARSCPDPTFAGYWFGNVKCRHAFGALRILSVSDANKPIMLKSNVLSLLIRGLKLFADNADQISGDGMSANEKIGGGGEDGETAEYIIEALLQLSFNYEVDDVMREKYQLAAEAVGPTCDLISILNECLVDPRNKLSGDSKRNVSALLKRLKPEPVVSSRAVTTVKDTKHIMLSYSWAVNKPLVAAIGSRLRELGHDVWRDEEGSAVLGPMSGDADEMMAAAIEHSHTVIVFVSPQYKESANCRTEAKYAKQRQLMSPLTILYVMMCENYHTRSNPPVDGWLALNIGTDLWYPLWNASMLNSTAQALSDTIAKKNADALRVAVVPVSNVAVAAPTVVVSPSGVDWNAAWSILEDRSSCANVEGLIKLLDDLGVSSKEDLAVLVADELTAIGVLLKPARKRRFLSAVNV